MPKANVLVLPALINWVDEDARYHREVKLYRPEAVAIVENAKGEIFFGKSPKSNNWGFPQDGIEPNEGVIDALERGLLEETGIVLSEIRKLCHIDLHNIPEPRDGFRYGKRYYYFYCWCDCLPVVTLKRNEMCDYRWLPPAQAGQVISELDDRYREKRIAMSMALAKAIYYP